MNTSPQGIASSYADMTLSTPRHWSPEQALAVWECLDEITRLVWDRYETQLIELICDDIYEDNGPQIDLFDSDDNISF